MKRVLIHYYFWIFLLYSCFIYLLFYFIFFSKKFFFLIWQGQQELTVDIVTEFSALFRQIYLFIGKIFSHFGAGKKS